jgi:hypothetical protein
VLATGAVSRPCGSARTGDGRRGPNLFIGPLLRQHAVAQSSLPSHWDALESCWPRKQMSMSHSTRCPRIFSKAPLRLCRHRREKVHLAFHRTSLAETLQPSPHDTVVNCKSPQAVDHVVSNFDVRTLLEHVSIWSSEIAVIDARVSTEARRFKARDALCSMRSNLQN